MKVAAIQHKLDIFYRFLFKRRLPFGLFSWRFFLPAQSESVNFHRRLVMQFYPQIPVPLKVILLLFTGFKWMFFYSPYYTFLTVNKFGRERRAEIGLPLWQQYWRVLRLSMGHGLAPISWYQFRLYLPERDLWSYVYDQEVQAFHHYRNRGRPRHKQAVALLGDKWRFEQYLLSKGVSTAGTLLRTQKGVTTNCRYYLEVLTQQQGRLFCKRRKGNQGKGAFSTFWKEGRLQIKPMQEVPLGPSEVDAFLNDSMERHDYLIQPEYQHHQRIEDALDDSVRPAITIRIISTCSSEHCEVISLVSAVIYWTAVEEGSTRLNYPLAIDLSRGALDEVYPAWPRDYLDDEQQLALSRFTKLLLGKPLPFWEEAVQLVCKSHSLIPGVDQIAWDLILSGDRAIILEGNSGWGGLAVHQWFGYDALEGY